MRPPPILRLVRTSTSSTTYEFRVASPDMGWALCTVNDGTGELLITSDWGSWSYLWSPNPSHLGAATLTHFIAERNAVDYLADKLLGRRGSSEFDALGTVAHFHKQICARRLADGQKRNARLRGYGDDRDQEIAIRNGLVDESYGGRTYLTASTARYLWEEIESLGNDVNDDGSPSTLTLFVERFCQLDNYLLISEEPWEDCQTRETNSSKILRLTILPALVDACRTKAQEPAYVELHATFLAQREKEHAERELAAKQVAKESRS